MLEPGTRVAGYEILGVLGRGGMGVVYEARQLSLDRVVALKLLSAELSRDVVFRERFRREGLMQAAIEHPHIVTIHEAGEAEQGLFLSMRLIRGPNLKDLIVGGELDPGRGLQILVPVASALDAAHGAGLVHRDLKPQNILVGPGGAAYLADFGLTIGPGGHTLTRSGQFLGTLNYTSPEQIEGQRASAASDVYSFTAVLFEAITGAVPYPAESEAALLHAHLSKPPPRPSATRPDLPGSLDEVIERGMAKRPEDRFQSAGELLEAAVGAFDSASRSHLSIPAPSDVRDAAQDVRVTDPEALDRGAVTAPDTSPPPAAPITAPERTRTDMAEVPAMAEAPDAAEAPTEPVPPARPAPARPREPQRPAPPHRRRRTIAISAILVVGAVAALLALSQSGGDEETAGEPVAAGSIALADADGWERSSDATRIPGLDLASRFSLSTDEAELTGGGTAAKGARLLPASFVKRLRQPPDRRERVRLGELEAYRYPKLQVAGVSRPTTVYVVPHTKGVATLACLSASVSACDDVTTTLEIRGARPYPLGPSESYARRLNGAVRALERERRPLRASLARADDADAQARFSTRLSGAYARSRRSLAGTNVSPETAPSHERIVSSMSAVHSAYARMAAAARREDEPAFATAKGSVTSGERRLARALEALADLGYKI